MLPPSPAFKRTIPSRWTSARGRPTMRSPVIAATMPAHKKKWSRRLLLALLSIVAFDQLLFWTCVTRPAGGIRPLIELTGSAEPPHYELAKDLDVTYRSWGKGVPTRIRTSALGFRDRQRPAARPAGIRRVLATGDSITFGLGVNDDEAYPQRLELALAEQGHGDVEVWNAGVPGYAMADHLGLLRKRLLPLGPDLVLLQLSRNDNAIPMPLGSTFLSLMRFSGLARAYMIVRFNFVEDPALFSASFRSYVDECESAGVKLVVLFEGLPEENRDEIVRITSEAGIPLIEIGGDAYPKLPDDPHYSPEGNRRVAARLVPEVLSMLGKP